MGQNLGKKDDKGESPVIDLSNGKSLDKFIQDARKSGSLKTIERLDLSRQELAEIPPQIGKLSYLKILNMYDNGLKSLPPELGTQT